VIWAGRIKRWTGRIDDQTDQKKGKKPHQSCYQEANTVEKEICDESRNQKAGGKTRQDWKAGRSATECE
jgi:hypothetical protein